ncbi:HNH endonuclease [Clostridium sp. UBA7791]|uniref:HNH endonuclease n=1 Tax=Clostridium sp. UBA7791 TaxID=1946379 RepID=UPI0032171D63
MANINGDWFHSRSSSNITELLTVRDIINESKKLEYNGMSWSGGRYGNQRLYDLAIAGRVKPSTLQTKLRAMIRFGFLEDNKYCPIRWSKMGQVWNDLYVSGNEEVANQIYKCILIVSLATIAFINEKPYYELNPAKGELPLKYLLNNLDCDNSISISNFYNMVDGNTTRVGDNISYWKKDLVNSGLFKEDNGYLVYTCIYNELVEEIKKFIPDSTLSDEDWILIRQNPMIDISPFKESVRKIFEAILDNSISDSNEFNQDPISEIISEQLENRLPQVDILSTETNYITSTRKVRNSTWSKRVKKRYNNKCVVPECDVEGELFVQGCHIKPDNLNEEGTPHRAHILNGVCMCYLCHKLFDNGYFTFDDNGRIIVSSEIAKLPEQRATKVIKMSENKIIKSSNDRRLPLHEFIDYHRKNIFKP